MTLKEANDGVKIDPMLLCPLSPNPNIVNSMVSSSSNLSSQMYDSEFDISEPNLQLPIESVLNSTMMTLDAEGPSEITMKSKSSYTMIYESFETQIRNYRTKNQKHFQDKCKWYSEIKKVKDVEHYISDISEINSEGMDTDENESYEDRIDRGLSRSFLQIVPKKEYLMPRVQKWPSNTMLIVTD